MASPSVLHGSTLLTRDLDICLPMDWAGLSRLQDSLRELNPRLRAGAGWIPLELDEAKAKSVKNLYITTDEGRLDCLGRVEGVGDFEAARRESVEMALGEGTCSVLGLDALIRSKEALGRPHDLEALVQLKAIREKQQRK